MNRKIQSSESLVMGLLLALAGGFLDVTTYLTRGNVFTYAVTGNIIFLGINLSQGKYGELIKYILPIAAFGAGIFLTEELRHRIHFKRLHWRQGIILIEMVFVILSATIPQGRFNFISNILLAFISSMQTEAFRKFNENPFASTMCTGNMRSSAYNLHRYRITKDRNYLIRSFQYALIILLFFTGAAAGGQAVKYFQEKTVLFALIPLIFAYIIMTKENW